MDKKLKGFTLIEMLIVITIIALLSSLILVGMGGARTKARDSRRIADLHNIQNALELYYAKLGTYPPGTYNSSTSWNTFTELLIDEGIGVNRVPKDPLNDTTRYYRYGGTATDYVLGALLEQSDTALNDDIDDTTNGIVCTDPVYCITP
ncbi:MAG: type II secretion system protein [Candidatus Paceibacterota bacterium]|jgi:general secretion pathway protein G